MKKLIIILSVMTMFIGCMQIEQSEKTHNCRDKDSIQVLMCDTSITIESLNHNCEDDR